MLPKYGCIYEPMSAVITVSYKGVEIAVRQVEGQHRPFWVAQFDGYDCCEQPAHLTLSEAFDHAKTLIDQDERHASFRHVS